MKIKNVKKFIRSVLIIVGVMFILSLIIVKSVLSYQSYEYKIIYVKNGDTLWSIAGDLQKNNNYYEGKDIRYIIGDLKEINDLNNSQVYSKQELKIPVLK